MIDTQENVSRETVPIEPNEVRFRRVDRIQEFCRLYRAGQMSAGDFGAWLKGYGQGIEAGNIEETPPQPVGEFTCGRRVEDGRANPESPFKGSGENLDTWNGGTCSYCGSIKPEDLLAAIKEGQTICPTDKNYKVYLGNKKFYFQHFTEDQKREFVELLNAKKIVFDHPGHFYVLPYFMTVTK